MIKVMHVDVEHVRGETCKPDREHPHGVYPKIDISIATGSMVYDPHTGKETYEHIMGYTCACGEGHTTYGTWRTPVEGMVFSDKEALMQYLCKNDNYPVSHGMEALNQSKYAEWGYQNREW